MWLFNKFLMMLRVKVRQLYENDDVVPDIGREEVVQSSTTRKRRRDPSQWTRNANKLKRASGEEYVNKNQQFLQKWLAIHVSVKGSALKRLEKTKSKLPLKDSCSYVTKISKMPISFHLSLATPLS